MLAGIAVRSSLPVLGEQKVSESIVASQRQTDLSMNYLSLVSVPACQQARVHARVPDILKTFNLPDTFAPRFDFQKYRSGHSARAKDTDIGSARNICRPAP